MRRALGAELSKLRTLPLTTYAAAGMILVSALIAAALAGVHAERGGAASAVDAVLEAMPYAQAGAILLGVVPVAHEYAGRQFSTTLIAVPRRMRVIVAKTCAAMVMLFLVGTLSVAVAWLSAELTHRASDAGGVAATAEDLARLGGAIVYLVLIGLLAHAATLVLRHLVPALVSMLVVVYILPFALTALGEHTRWLPTRAGSQLFAPDDAVLTAFTGALVLLAWSIALGVAGTARFTLSDA
ncbi:ABC transporter permease [Microbacterium oxydans]|uniref:ABC transporter permease n=1 Tax=Microbacterium sp. B19(2022) TaxID=2914045 RepID=UPI00142FB78C|nr:ABC transporter permease [Microbacterium sp. B19(2022)]NJI58304.1 ABC transporter permease [Microbacterium sp. B19(2022)]